MSPFPCLLKLSTDWSDNVIKNAPKGSNQPILSVKEATPPNGANVLLILNGVVLKEKPLTCFGGNLEQPLEALLFSMISCCLVIYHSSLLYFYTWISFYFLLAGHLVKFRWTPHVSDFYFLSSLCLKNTWWWPEMPRFITVQWHFRPSLNSYKKIIIVIMILCTAAVKGEI